MNAACPSTAAPPAVLATEAPVERVVVNVIEERKILFVTSHVLGCTTCTIDSQAFVL